MASPARKDLPGNNSVSYFQTGRNGFTLVELLVVITIIGMLMALLFPAVGAVIGNARQMKCQNQLGELAKAISTIESTKGRIPGYLHRLPVRQGGSSVQMQDVSWVVAVMEVLSEPDYTAIKNGNAVPNRQFSKMICPSDPPAQNDESISYVANCGMLDQGGGRTFPDRIGNGVFHREGSIRQGKFVKMTSDKIKGLDRTIMFSENRQATYWTSVNEAEIGILWWLDQSSPNFPTPESKMINKRADDIVQLGDPNYARPSSNHPGGVMIVFCDSSARFLSQEVAYVVYCQLMISDATRAGLPGQGGRLPSPHGDPVNMANLEL